MCSKIKQHNQAAALVWLKFTAVFFMITIAVLYPYWHSDRSLIRNADALSQHYPALAYYGEYLRSVLAHILSGDFSGIPTWDLSIGYGSDIITTLHYYCLGEPLALLSVFFDHENTELCYLILIVLRWYLAGTFMLLFCMYFHCSEYGAVLGALVYAFSGYSLAPGVFHPFFMIPMVYLPLILLGVEQIYRRKSPCLFIFSVALAALSNFYFFFMLAIMTMLYTTARYFCYFSEIRFRECTGWIARFVGYALLGLMIAGPVLLPNLSVLLQSDRFSTTHEYLLFYPQHYYLKLPAGLISYCTDFYFYVSVSPLAMISVFSLFTSKDAPRLLKPGFICLLIMALIPMVGSFFNGLSYPTNRWIWALIFVLGYITAVNYPRTEQLTARQWKNICIIAGCYALLCVMPEYMRNQQTDVSLMIMTGFLLLIYMRIRIPAFLRLYRVGIIVLTVFSLMYNGYYLVSPNGRNWSSYHVVQGESHKRYNDSPIQEVKSFSDADSTRFDPSPNGRLNNAMYLGLNGTGFYFSNAPLGATSFQRSQLLNTPMSQRYQGLDDRSYLAAALSVSYYVLQNQNTQTRPYGYDIPVGDPDCGIYTSNNTLPLVYAFDTVCTNSESLSVTQRQEALLQCAMTDYPCDLPAAELVFSEQELEYRVDADSNISISDGEILVTEDNAVLTLSFEPPINSELYLLVHGMEYISDVKATEISITFSCNTLQKKLTYKTPGDNFYCGYHDFLVNLGCRTGEEGIIEVVFPYAGSYRYSDFKIISQPMDEFSPQIEKLSNSGISQISVKEPNISFRANRESAGVACIAIPYSTGWEATIDGTAAEIFEVQDGLCGLLLPVGEHQVVLTYHTPLLKTGLFLFAMALVLIIVVTKFRDYPCPTKKQ